jgi:hypothetical protein
MKRQSIFLASAVDVVADADAEVMVASVKTLLVYYK